MCVRVCAHVYTCWSLMKVTQVFSHWVIASALCSICTWEQKKKLSYFDFVSVLFYLGFFNLIYDYILNDQWQDTGWITFELDIGVHLYRLRRLSLGPILSLLGCMLALLLRPFFTDHMNDKDLSKGAHEEPWLLVNKSLVLIIRVVQNTMHIVLKTIKESRPYHTRW